MSHPKISLKLQKIVSKPNSKLLLNILVFPNSGHMTSNQKYCVKVTASPRLRADRQVFCVAHVQACPVDLTLQVRQPE